MYRPAVVVNCHFCYSTFANYRISYSTWKHKISAGPSLNDFLDSNYSEVAIDSSIYNAPLSGVKDSNNYVIGEPVIPQLEAHWSPVRIPPWIKTQVPIGSGYARLKSSLETLKLNTVCQEAKCPNIGICWSGKEEPFDETTSPANDMRTKSDSSTFSDILSNDVNINNLLNDEKKIEASPNETTINKFISLNKNGLKNSLSVSTNKKVPSTATIMLMGDTCTRGCRFCAVKTSKAPPPLDPEEPNRTAEAISKWGVDYIVLTSVDRDDLPDNGASHFAKTVTLLHKKNPDILIECLTGDFRGSLIDASIVSDAPLNVYAHNIETVERLTPFVRDRRAGYHQSLHLLEFVKKRHPKLVTKSSIMLGLGETPEEIEKAMKGKKFLFYFRVEKCRC